MKLSVLMPVYNEAATIEEVVQRVRDVPIDKEIVIVDAIIGFIFSNKGLMYNLTLEGAKMTRIVR